MDENVGWLLEFVRKNLLISSVVGLGLLLTIGGGLWLFSSRSETTVEVIEASTKDDVEVGGVWVDVQGAVVNPGVYELGSEARVKDALAAAGGLSEEADRGRIARYINLAAEVGDGVKIFVPKEGDGEVMVGTGGEEVLGAADSGSVNINTASEAQLDELWGVGPARAREIVAGRPYEKVEDVAKVLPSNVYERVKSQLTVY